MKTVLWVGLGGFIGAILRYTTSLGFEKIATPLFPISTFLVNFLGCFILGLLINMGSSLLDALPVKEFLIIGLLGGFTTFSTFGLEIYEIFKSGEMIIGVIYMTFSIIAGVFGIWFSQFLVN